MVVGDARVRLWWVSGSILRWIHSRRAISRIRSLWRDTRNLAATDRYGRQHTVKLIKPTGLNGIAVVPAVVPTTEVIDSK
jgi:hypothetical protein